MYSCGAAAPVIDPAAPTARCGRPQGHRGVHVAYGPRGREVDTWPQLKDVIELKRQAGTL